MHGRALPLSTYLAGFFALGSKMAEWRKFAAKQKAMRRGKNQVVEESKVAEEIVVERMSGDVSGK